MAKLQVSPPLHKKRLIEGLYGLFCMLLQLSSFSILFLVVRDTRCIRSRSSNDASLRMTRYGCEGTWEKVTEYKGAKGLRRY